MKGKIALITGGNKGIGYGIAEALLKEGMHVAITSRTLEAATAAAESLSKAGTGNILPLKADVRSMSELQAAVAATTEEFGSLHTVVANAGVGHFASIEHMSEEQWNEVIEVNLTGVFNTVKACLDPIKESKGYIITIASLAGTNFFPSGAAYNASKFGLVGFTQAIMLDLRKYGVKVTTIMPGSVTSHFNGHVPSDKDAWKIQPEDIGKITVDLLKMHPRALPSKVEVRPTTPPSAK